MLTEALSLFFANGILHSSVELLSDFSRTAILIPFLVIALWKIKGLRTTLWILLIAGIGVALSDSISYQIVKRAVMRPRPHFLGSTCLENNCWGFVSSHAANVFCAASVIGYFVPRWRKALYFIAALVSFSRIALADHFPLDVIGGALLGLAIAYTITRFFLRVDARLCSEEVYD